MDDNKAVLDRKPEIVAALRCCANSDGDCMCCGSYQVLCQADKSALMELAAALIEAYAAQLAAVTSERDAAVVDLRVLAKEKHSCFACAEDKFDCNKGICNGCAYNDGDNWRWRGPQGAGEGGE